MWDLLQSKLTAASQSEVFQIETVIYRRSLSQTAGEKTQHEANFTKGAFHGCTAPAGSSLW